MQKLPEEITLIVGYIACLFALLLFVQALVLVLISWVEIVCGSSSLLVLHPANFTLKYCCLLCMLRCCIGMCTLPKKDATGNNTKKDKINC